MPRWTKMLEGDNWRRILQQLTILFAMVVLIAFGVIITFASIGLLARGFAALISWAI